MNKMYNEITIFMEDNNAMFEEDRWDTAERLFNMTYKEVEQYLAHEGFVVIEMEASNLFGREDLDIYVEEKCIYAKDCQTRFSKDYTFNHGINAFNTCDVLDNAYNVVNNPDAEICCSFEGQYVGDIGYYIQGECLVASNTDLSSDYGKEGRFFKYYNNKDRIFHESQIEEILSHGEAILRNFKVVGIWVDKRRVNTWSYELAEMQKLTGINEIILI